MQTNKFHDLCVLIPAFNEEFKIVEVVNNLSKHFQNILIIDDGSTDRTGFLCKSLPVKLISHPYNMGTGAAFQSGINYLNNETHIKYVITFDADGQHHLHDAINLAIEIQKVPEEIIFGSRFLSQKSNVPLIKRLTLNFAKKITNFFFNISLSDAHMGLKAFKKSCFSKIEIHLNTYSYETELIQQVSFHRIKFKEMPVNVTYSHYSKKKGQSIFNSLRILEDMLKIYLKIFMKRRRAE